MTIKNSIAILKTGVHKKAETFYDAQSGLVTGKAGDMAGKAGDTSGKVAELVNGLKYYRRRRASG